MKNPFTFIIAPILGYLLALSQGHTIHHQIASYILGVFCLFISAHCLSSLENPGKIWNKFLFAQICFLGSSFMLKGNTYHGVILYSLTAIPCWIIGRYALTGFQNIDMKKFNGLYVLNPTKEFLFLIAFLGISGFPLFTTFWAEDIIFTEIILDGPVLLTITALSLMLNGLVSARILTKVFWGFPSYIKY
jgi:hypothetical protein